MRIPGGLTSRRAVLSAATVLALTAIVLATDRVAQAAPVREMCVMDTARGAISGAFPLDACVDASYVHVRDQLTVPVHLTTSGSAGSPVVVAHGDGVAAAVTRLRFHDPLLLIPGDTIKIPFGTSAASVTIKDTAAGGFYALATTLATFLPLGAAPAVYDALVKLVTELDDDFTQYADCLAGKNWIGQLGCSALLDRNVRFALGRATVGVFLAVAKGDIVAIINLLLSAKTFTDFTGQQVPDVSTIVNAIRQGHATISIAAKPSTDSGGGPAGPSGGSGAAFSLSPNKGRPGSRFSVGHILDCPPTPAGKEQFLNFTFQDAAGRHTDLGPQAVHASGTWLSGILLDVPGNAAPGAAKVRGQCITYKDGTPQGIFLGPGGTVVHTFDTVAFTVTG